MKNKKKIALVTGSSRGIGKCIAQTLSNSNIFVIGTSTNTKGVKKINKFLYKNGTGVKLNFLKIKDLKNTLKEILKKFPIIDIIIHNAGIIKDSLLINMKEKDWNSVISVNLSSIFYISKIIIPGMIKKKTGRIILIGSLNGHIGSIGQTNYSASKSGLIGFARSLSLEVAFYKITVNIISPGYIDTDMIKKIAKKSKKIKKIPLGYLGKTQDISKLILFLISNESSYITGQVIHVNGGMYMP